MASLRLAANNLWVQCERYNLMALALRRMAVGDDDTANSAKRQDWGARSLEFNQEAIQLASLGGSQLSLANYMSNRALLLADLASAGVVDGGRDRPGVWVDAIRWLGLGEDLARGLERGRRNVVGRAVPAGDCARCTGARGLGRPSTRAGRGVGLVCAQWCARRDFSGHRLRAACRRQHDVAGVGWALRIPADRVLRHAGRAATAERRDLSAYPGLALLRAWAAKTTGLAADRQRAVDAFLACFSGHAQRGGAGGTGGARHA